MVVFRMVLVCTLFLATGCEQRARVGDGRDAQLRDGGPSELGSADGSVSGDGGSGRTEDGGDDMVARADADPPGMESGRATPAQCEAYCSCSEEPSCADDCLGIRTYGNAFWRAVGPCLGDVDCAHVEWGTTFECALRDGAGPWVEVCGQWLARADSCGLSTRSVMTLCPALSSAAHENLGFCLDAYARCDDFEDCLLTQPYLQGLPRAAEPGPGDR